MKTKFFLSGIFILAFKCIGFSQSQLWMLTNQGGANNVGAIVSVDPLSPVLTNHHSFQPPDGYHPYGKLVQADDGKLYGTCYDGGYWSSCTIFSFDPNTNVYTDVHDFDIVHGDFPKSGLAKGSNGILYGVTTTGGSNLAGVLYSWNTISGTYTMLHEFGNGSTYPQGAPVIHSNGKIYGMAYGGLYGMGIIYSYDINTATMSGVYSFTGSGGSAPVGSLIEAADGKLYGLTPSGGSAGYGVLFSFDPLSNLFSKLFDFDLYNGMSPMGSLMQATNGMLYGMADTGGFFNSGTLFEFNINNSVYTKIQDFVPVQGVRPTGDLFEMANVLYGATKNGGVYSYGTIFSYSLITNSLSIVANFDSSSGANPAGGLIAFQTTGLPSIQENNFIIYPNPVNEIMIINESSGVFNQAEITVSDLTGKQILNSTLISFNNSSLQLDVSMLHPGFYILSFAAGDKLRQLKFVKN